MTTAEADIPTDERRGRTQQVINQLLTERQQMLAAFCAVAGLEPYTPDKPVDTLVREFCQLLVDYTALGHFELYQRFLDGQERRQEVGKLAHHSYAGIVTSTDRAISFNDKYDGELTEARLTSLPHDLGELGEQLATRADLEDRLIKKLLHRA